MSAGLVWGVWFPLFNNYFLLYFILGPTLLWTCRHLVSFAADADAYACRGNRSAAWKQRSRAWFKGEARSSSPASTCGSPRLPGRGWRVCGRDGPGSRGLGGQGRGEKHVILDAAGEIIGRDLWASEGAVNLVCEIECGFGVWGISCGVGLP